MRKQTLREFERKVRAERKNAEEIAYQFIYNQNKQLIQQELANDPEEDGRTPTDDAGDAARGPTVQEQPSSETAQQE